jgi:lipopolysaccharide heptosyltransferase II
MLDFSIYLLYRAGVALVSVLPLRGLFIFGEGLGVCAWMLLGKYRRLALRNLGIAFGRDKSKRELRRIARKHFRRLGSNLLCSVKLGLMPLDQIARYVDVENVDAVHGELRAGRPVVLVLSHLGNWELVAQFLPSLIGYVRNGTVFQKLGNRFIDQHVQKLRSRAGVELFDRREGFQKAFDLLRGGGAIGILSDQHAGDQGIWTPFFGRLASTSPLPGLLAKRTSAALIGTAVYTAGRARWRIVFTPPFDAPEDSAPALTAKVNAIVAEQIRRAPEDWFWVHNRWKTPRPKFLLSRYKRGVFLPPEISPQDLQRFRILIRAPNWLGDSVITIPAVRAIKNGRPDAHITIAAPEKNAAVWKLVPEVDEVLSIPNRSLLGTVAAIRRQTRFDAAVLFPNSLRAALEVWLAGVPRRAGYRGHRRSRLLNQIVPERKKIGPLEHQADRYLDLAREFGASTGDVAKIDITLRSEPASDHKMKLGLCPGAEYGPAKRWLPDRFAEVASTIAVQMPAQWFLYGTSTDSEIGRAIEAGLGDKCVNRIGQTTLDELISELRDCRLLLTNDTGTMHLATLLGVPVVAIFGSTEPRLTGPLGQRDRVIRHQVECSPCFLRKCPIDFRCMKAVAVDEVVTAVMSILQTNSTKDAKITKMI